MDNDLLEFLGEAGTKALGLCHVCKEPVYHDQHQLRKWLWCYEMASTGCVLGCAVKQITTSPLVKKYPIHDHCWDGLRNRCYTYDWDADDPQRPQ